MVCRTHLYTAKTLFNFFEGSISFTSWLSLVVHIINIIPPSKQMTIFMGGWGGGREGGNTTKTMSKHLLNLYTVPFVFVWFRTVLAWFWAVLAWFRTASVLKGFYRRADNFQRHDVAAVTKLNNICLFSAFPNTFLPKIHILLFWRVLFSFFLCLLLSSPIKSCLFFTFVPQ